MTNHSLNGNDELPQKVKAAVLAISKLEAPDEVIDRLVKTASMQNPLVEAQRVEAQLVEVPLAPKSRNFNESLFVSRLLAAAAVFLVIAFVSFWSSGPPQAYALMQDALANVKNIQCLSKVIDADGKELYSIKSFVMEPRLVRQEFSEDVVVIADISEKKAMEINHTNRTVRFSTLEGAEASLKFFDAVMGVVRGSENQHAEEVGRKNVGETTIIEYQVKADGFSATAFVDEITHELTKIVVPMGENGVHIDISEFVFDKHLDRDWFALKMPEGYEVTTDEMSQLLPPNSSTELELAHNGGIGCVRLGMTKDEVLMQMGSPEVIGYSVAQKELEVEKKTEFFNYRSKGIQIQVHPTSGVTQVVCSESNEQFETQRFAGQYQGGIQIGDSVESVVNSLGEPEDMNGFDDQTKSGWFVYTSLDDECVTHFRFKGGALKTISVKQKPLD